jgi:hypothetical protein
LLLGVFITSAGVEKALAMEKRNVVVTATATPADDEDNQASVGASASKNKQIIIEAVEPEGEKKKAVTWLGVSTEEVSEALASQLALESGEGLVVTYLAEDSPAAKAGLKRNDVLVEFGEQMLVHPAQLRKLVKMHKEGDTVKLALYRSGKKQIVSVTLGKTARGRLLGDADDSWREGLQNLNLQIKDLKIGENVREHMKELHDSLAHAGVDKQKLRLEVQLGMEQARKALQEALRGTTNANWMVGNIGKEIEELARSGMGMGKDTTVTVQKDRKSIKTMVKTDAAGSYVLIATPKKRLSAHDNDGKLLFDGEIETPAQQDKVPREVWEKVKPMLEQLGTDKADQPEAEKEPDEPDR